MGGMSTFWLVTFELIETEAYGKRFIQMRQKKSPNVLGGLFLKDKETVCTIRPGSQ
jgi:hypothetical protein